MLGAGFDPGVVNAYAALAVKHYFDGSTRSTSSTSTPAATAATSRPTSTRRSTSASSSRSGPDRPRMAGVPDHAVKWTFTFPVVGEQPIYLNGHDELHSLATHIDAAASGSGWALATTTSTCSPCCTHSACCRTSRCRRRWWRSDPSASGQGRAPDPQSLAASYTGNTCIGDVIKGTKTAGRGAVHLSSVRSRRGIFRRGVAGDQLHRAFRRSPPPC